MVLSVDIPVAKLREDAALVLAGGSEDQRDLATPGRGLEGVHFTMDFLPANSNRFPGGNRQR
jgi:glutamate synthase (NADPH/NADH) small chain